MELKISLVLQSDISSSTLGYSFKVSKLARIYKLDISIYMNTCSPEKFVMEVFLIMVLHGDISILILWEKLGDIKILDKHNY